MQQIDYGSIGSKNIELNGKYFLNNNNAKKTKNKCLASGNPTDPPLLPQTQNLFRHNLHSVKIGNLRSVRQAQFRLRSVVSVQGQYVKTGVQVNHVFFYPIYVPQLTVLVFLEMYVPQLTVPVF